MHVKDNFDIFNMADSGQGGHHCQLLDIYQRYMAIDICRSSHIICTVFTVTLLIHVIHSAVKHHCI